MCIRDSVWGGDSLEDNCGTCDNDPTNDCTQDCAGVWGGPLTIDALGVCGGYCEADTDGDGVCDIDEIEGCQDETACNYNPNATDPCPEIQEIEGFNLLGSSEGSNYYASIEAFSWLGANEVANSLGGHLVTINSEEEQTLMQNIVTGVEFWIGLFQNTESGLYYEPNGGWEWITGEPVNYTYWNSCLLYTSPSPRDRQKSRMPSSA